MQRLEPPDSHCLNAAIGWLGLGRRDDAKAELEMISAPNQRHPDVLEARWAIYAEERQWEAALDVARKLLQRAPHRVSGWLHHAYALRRAPEGGLEKAWAALKPAVEKFQHRHVCSDTVLPRDREVRALAVLPSPGQHLTGHKQFYRRMKHPNPQPIHFTRSDFATHLFTHRSRR